MGLVELPHLSVGSPSEIATPRVLQIKMGDRREAARGVKARSQLIGERLVVDKAVYACRSDGLFIELLGIERTYLDTSNLGTNQRRSILKVLRTIRRPCPKLLLVSYKYLSMIGVRFGA